MDSLGKQKLLEEVRNNMAIYVNFQTGSGNHRSLSLKRSMLFPVYSLLD